MHLEQPDDLAHQAGTLAKSRNTDEVAGAFVSLTEACLTAAIASACLLRVLRPRLPRRLQLHTPPIEIDDVARGLLGQRLVALEGASDFVRLQFAFGDVHHEQLFDGRPRAAGCLGENQNHILALVEQSALDHIDREMAQFAPVRSPFARTPAHARGRERWLR